MKKIIGGFAALAFLLVLGSCGGASEADMIGKWKMDAGSIDLKLGDGVPAEMKAMVEFGKKEMMSEGKEDIEGATVEFKKGGVFTVSMDGQSEDGKWKLDGDNVVLTMKPEGAKKEVSISLIVEEVSGDAMTLTLTAEELVNTIKKQDPNAMKMIESMSGQSDIEKMIDGTQVSFTMKK